MRKTHRQNLPCTDILAISKQFRLFESNGTQGFVVCSGPRFAVVLRTTLSLPRSLAKTKAA
jgi:hypothetical protein